MIVTVSRYAHDTPLPVSRMIADLGNKMQICTQVDRGLRVGVISQKFMGWNNQPGQSADKYPNNWPIKDSC